MSECSVTGWPMRMRATWTSLKFASTHKAFNGTIDISGVPASNALPDLHRTLGDVAGDRRRQRCAAIGQVGGLHLAGGALHVRMLGDRGAVGQHAVGIQLFARRLQCRFGALQCAARMLDFFLGDRAGLRNRWRRFKSAGARSTSSLRALTLAASVPLLTKSVRTSRTVCANCASA